MFLNAMLHLPPNAGGSLGTLGCKLQACVATAIPGIAVHWLLAGSGSISSVKPIAAALESLFTLLG
jgi:hypothetical protein